MLELALHRPDGHTQVTIPPSGVVVRVGLRGEVTLAPLAVGGMLAPSRGVRITPSAKQSVCLWSDLRLDSLPSEGGALLRGERIATPLRFQLGEAVVEIVDPARQAWIAKPTRFDSSTSRLSTWLASFRESLTTLSRWTNAVNDTCQLVTHIVGELGEFDGVYALRSTNKQTDSEIDWSFSSAWIRNAEQGVWFDRALLRTIVLYLGETTLFLPDEASTRHRAPATVVAPWRDAVGEIAGVLVGLKRGAAGEPPTFSRDQPEMVRLAAERIGAATKRQSKSTTAALRRDLLHQVLASRYIKRARLTAEFV
jgi:hypothetical protein